MATANHQARIVLQRILQGKLPEDRAGELRPRMPKEEPLPRHLPSSTDHSEEGLNKRRARLKEQGISTQQLSGEGEEISLSDLEGNIENFIGFARIPVGVIGPLRINGFYAHGDFFVPMASTEGALVASYNRGANLVSQAGGITVLCMAEAVSRAPCFEFGNILEAGQFISWVLTRVDSLQEIVARTSRHCKFIDLKVSLIGKEVYLIFEFTTGDASGQNMVTIATEAICKEFIKNAPLPPQNWYLEGNMSGDKKATMLSFTSVRGKDVVAETVIPEKLVRRFLHTKPADLVRYWETSIVGGIQSGSIGVQGHYSNALAAIFMACGQDVACVSEASVGVTRMDLNRSGDLYVSVKLPNLIVGTVGGGTHLPTAAECLDMIGCRGEGQARKFAEICAATVLSGEISITGSLAAGDFGLAHAQYGRKSKKT